MNKQSIVNITGAGYVNKINLTNEDGVIKGTISIRLSNDSVVVFNVYETKFNKSTGKENFRYKALETVISEYVDSTQVDDYTQATKVYIGENKSYPHFPNATINVNIYESQGAVQINTRNSLKLINRIKEGQEVYPSMRFKIDGFVVEELLPEYDKMGQETGRGLLKGYIVDYNGMARPLELKIIEEGYKSVASIWKQFDVLNLRGDVVNKSIKKESEIPEDIQGGFITTENKPTYEYIKEYVVTDAMITYESFTKEECQQAINELEEFKNSLLALNEQENVYDNGNIPF